MADMLTPNRAAKAGDSKGLQRMFAPDRLTPGVFFPIEAFRCATPASAMSARCAIRGSISAGSRRRPIARGVASVDRLSGNRLVLGVDFEQRAARFRDPVGRIERSHS